MKLGVCRLCLKNKEIVRSHVFPEFFYKPVYDEQHKFVSLSSNSKHKLKSFQIGFREHLLCKTCETQISRYENYVKKLLLKDGKYKIEGNNTILVLKYDYRLFKLFGLSLIWRFHISSKDHFKDVNLRLHAEKIRQMLVNEDPGDFTQYCFFLIKIEGAKSAATVITAPAATRFRDHNAYSFMAYGYQWMFVVSSHSDKLLRDLPFADAKHKLEILVKSYTESSFINKMRQQMAQI